MSPTPAPELDVRPLLAAGQSPLETILAHVATLPAGAAFRLRAPFEPQPLYTRLAGVGFDHCATRQSDSSFVVLFTPKTVRLDLRLLEPPEPLQRTLEAATLLPPRGRLVTRTRFRPVHLLEMLAERGFVAASEEQPDGSWENVIVRASASTA
ncbi:MAG: DUF2249 domain-containing protein [Opitutaceae bacterium]